MFDIDSKLIQKIIDELDQSFVKEAYEESIKEYFKSEEFKSSVVEALYEDGVGYQLGETLAKNLSKALKGAKIEVKL